ncbi:MAG: 4Fe-4S binding protein, partial [Gammaproteobacteria bacterium]
MAYSYDLLQLRWIRALVQSRTVQLIILLLTSMGYSLAIFTGFFGSPVGSANFATIWVWLVWWGIFVILFLPFFGRLWCAVCPIPIAGEYIQRKSFFGGSLGKKIKLSPRFFPTQLQGMWLSNILFFLFAIFAGKLTTNPRLTALTLLLLLATSITTAVKYRERSFCRHLCPIGGSIGIYSLTNPIELRVKSTDVCKNHHSKDCVFGNDKSFGCPWMVYPGSLKSNQNCGLCMECVRACDLDNISLNFRPLKDDLLKEVPKFEEDARVFLLLMISVMYPVVFLGTWNELTRLSNFTNIPEFTGFSLVVALVTTLISGYFMIPNYLLLKNYHSREEALLSV